MKVVNITEALKVISSVPGIGFRSISDISNNLNRIAIDIDSTEARWNEIKQEGPFGAMFNKIVCSNCGQKHLDPHRQDRPNYCDNCGCYMKSK